MKLNTPEKCLVCFNEPDEFELIKHHVQYFPEVICYVHYKCHKEIHAGKHPHLIQYAAGDSWRFYQ